MIGNNFIDKKFFDDRDILSFDIIKQYIQGKGQNLQVLTSKQVAEKLSSKKARLISRGCDPFIFEEGDKYYGSGNDTNGLQKQVDSQYMGIQRLKDRCNFMQSDNIGMKAQTNELYMLLDDIKNELINTEELLTDKRLTIKLLQSSVKQVSNYN